MDNGPDLLDGFSARCRQPCVFLTMVHARYDTVWHQGVTKIHLLSFSFAYFRSFIWKWVPSPLPTMFMILWFFDSKSMRQGYWWETWAEWEASGCLTQMRAHLQEPSWSLSCWGRLLLFSYSSLINRHYAAFWRYLHHCLGRIDWLSSCLHWGCLFFHSTDGSVSQKWLWRFLKSCHPAASWLCVLLQLLPIAAVVFLLKTFGEHLWPSVVSTASPKVWSLKVFYVMED